MMKRLICCSFLLITFAQAIVGQTDWARYKFDDQLNFKIYSPGEMIVEEQEIATVVGDITATTYAHKGIETDPNYLYLINVVSYPENTFSQDSTELIEEFLYDAVQQIADGVSGVIAYNSATTFLGIPTSKLFRVTFDEGYNIIKGRTFITDDYFVSLQVYTTRKNSLNNDMDAFLDSFTLMEN